MSTSFDDILKKGKDRAVGPADPRINWKHKVYNLMKGLLELNEAYGNNKHNVKIEICVCDKCLKASYVVMVRDFNDDSRIIRFHQSGWNHLGKSLYNCDECK